MLLWPTLIRTAFAPVGEDLPPFCPVLDRALAWDPKGAYALDADEPLTPAAREIVKDLLEAERGRAESLSRYRLRVDEDDLVPAWVLSQILRVRKGALAEYDNDVSRRMGERASVPVLLYRLHVCRLAELELPLSERRSGAKHAENIRRDQNALADRLRPAATDRLGVAIGVTQVSLDWIVEDRRTLAAYRSNHPNGPDVRPLIAQAYLSGKHHGPRETLFTDKATNPEEPSAQKGLEIAKAILKDQPADAMGHYYVGLARFYLGQVGQARNEFEESLKSGSLPPRYEQGARAFIARPSYSALRPKTVY